MCSSRSSCDQQCSVTRPKVGKHCPSANLKLIHHLCCNILMDISVSLKENLADIDWLSPLKSVGMVIHIQRSSQIQSAASDDEVQLQIAHHLGLCPTRINSSKTKIPVCTTFYTSKSSFGSAITGHSRLFEKKQVAT